MRDISRRWLKRYSHQSAGRLPFAGFVDAVADLDRWFVEAAVGELFVSDARDFEVDFNPVHERAGNAFLVAGVCVRGAGS